MLLDKCPHCDTQHVQASVRFNEQVKEDVGLWWLLVRCQNPSCKRLVLVAQDGGGSISFVFPNAKYELSSSAEIASEIRDDFREAGLCLGAGCHKASMVMSRRVLQRCLKEQGCDQHRLVDAIKNAIDSGVLRKAFHSIADEIRHYGNLGAHPDDEQLA